MHLDTTIGRAFVRLHVENVAVICHGLPYDPGSVVEKSYDDLAKYFAKRGIDSVIFDFSGTGLSKGEFRISNWVEDLMYIVDRFNEVNLIGFSMGGVIATYVAANSKNVKSLATISSPCCSKIFNDRVLEMIYSNARTKGVLRGIEGYDEFIGKFKADMEEFEPIKWIGNVNVPVLIVHGTADEIVSYENAEILFKAANEPKKLLKVKNGSHFLRRERRVIDRIIDWLIGINTLSINKKNYGSIEEL
ncbi:alpha/beta hydrolase [Archaeoglobales archaeon]|nr:MAG: alpha/beta hydrolase [Archaeoglobales archaeon]